MEEKGTQTFFGGSKKVPGVFSDSWGEQKGTGSLFRLVTKGKHLVRYKRRAGRREWKSGSSSLGANNN